MSERFTNEWRVERVEAGDGALTLARTLLERAEFEGGPIQAMSLGKASVLAQIAAAHYAAANVRSRVDPFTATSVMVDVKRMHGDVAVQMAQAEFQGKYRQPAAPYPFIDAQRPDGAKVCYWCGTPENAHHTAGCARPQEYRLPGFRAPGGVIPSPPLAAATGVSYLALRCGAIRRGDGMSLTCHFDAGHIEADDLNSPRYHEDALSGERWRDPRDTEPARPIKDNPQG